LTGGDALPAAGQDQLDDAGLQSCGHLGSACGIWIVSAIIAVVPLAIIAEVSYPYPQMHDVVTVLAAGALPGLYFGLTARGPHGRTWPMALLPVLSKFSATVMISLALAAIGEVGAYGVIMAAAAILSVAEIRLRRPRRAVPATGGS
jgi:hypothetical protein